MLAEKAYLEMYPEARLGKYTFYLKYSGKFKGYNANITRKGDEITFRLSRNWKAINDDVKTGLMQGLFNKLFKTMIVTQNTDLYEIFLKKVHVAVKKTQIDEVLNESFNRVNEGYFYGLIEKPNLRWGKDSVRTLGSYDYGSDTITVSRIFNGESANLLDYIMYHEMLHKKHKFHTKAGKSYHHTKIFRKQEKKFQNMQLIEDKINRLVRRKRKDLNTF